jgi:hypothetical protein
MSQEQEQPPELDARAHQAIAELEQTIRQRYPAAAFELSPSPEDPRSIHLIAIVDVDDPDEVGDLVLDRVLDLSVEEGIPVHVIPVRPTERIAAEKQRQRGLTRRRVRPFLSKHGLLRH